MDYRSQLVAIGFLAFVVGQTCAVTFTVGPDQEECFYEEVHVGQKITANFQVASGGFLDIDVKVESPSGKVIYDGERESDGRYSFVAIETGDYKFCFSNKMSTVTAKSVMFGVLLGDDPEAEVVKEEHIQPLEGRVNKLHRKLKEIHELQSYMRIREHVHRNTSESTNSRVLWWSFFEAVLLVAMSVFQIFYLRRFFEVKRVV